VKKDPSPTFRSRSRRSKLVAWRASSESMAEASFDESLLGRMPRPGSHAVEQNAAAMVWHDGGPWRHPSSEA
jgi:hypothetical protein